MKKAFTLIELLVVIMILVILGSMAIKICDNSPTEEGNSPLSPPPYYESGYEEDE
jgi:prepilin-type N-terminal cleavage/methylation domain-containing protein